MKQEVELEEVEEIKEVQEKEGLPIFGSGYGSGSGRRRIGLGWEGAINRAPTTSSC
jgi:hypothetical protein